ncbi:MAG: type II secretion system protein [Sulfurimonas sp.]|nr:type II secretion system protein [Sulfurimonas sp.]
MVRHSAFTMIELIFAIVIIAISVLSLPMMSQITSKNIEGSLVQEAIFAASAELNQIISFSWDENSMDTNTFLSRVAWGSDCNATTKLRSGHISRPYHRRCTDNILGPTAITNGSSTFLNDINTTAHSIFINSGGSSTGYKKTYNSQFTVSYAAFETGFVHNNNIKKIDVNITDTTTGDLVTKLTTFSSNIGEIDYYKRSY